MDNEGILKTLQRKETEMKILHGKDANRSHENRKYEFLLIKPFTCKIAKLERRPWHHDFDWMANSFPES